MLFSVNFMRKLDTVDAGLKDVLYSLLEEVERTREESVTKKEFQELSEIVRDMGKTMLELGQVQKRTALKVEELTAAQQRTEVRMEELTAAQQRTEIKMTELAEAQKETQQEMRRLVKEVRRDLGGLSLSVRYGFENEVYRMLPGLLQTRYGIELTERMVRAEIGGKEVNIFGRGKQNGKAVAIVGEVKLRLDERREKGEKTAFEELEEKVQAVQREERDREIVRLLITHYATKGFLRKAKERGVIVVESFEW